MPTCTLQRKTQIADMRNIIKKTLIHVVFFINRRTFLPDKNFYVIIPVPAFDY